MNLDDGNDLAMQSTTQHVRSGNATPTTALAVIRVESSATEGVTVDGNKTLWTHAKSDDLWTELSFADVTGTTLVAGLAEFGAAYLFCDAMRTRLVADGIVCVATIFIDVWPCRLGNTVPTQLVEAAKTAANVLDVLEVRLKSNGPLLESNKYPLVFVTPDWYSPPEELQTSLARAPDIQLPGIADAAGVWVESRPADDQGKSVSERIVDTHGRVIKGVLTIYWENRRK